MALIRNTYGDNPQQPAIFAEQYVPDQLIAGHLNLVTQPILVGGAQILPRGTVLGQVTSLSNAVSAAGTNTGNGTVGSITTGNGVKQGAYALVATSATTFSVTDPTGAALPNATAGTAYSNSGIGFTITAGGTAFVAGDSFTLNVMDAIGTFILSVKGASDGSQNPAAILVDYTDPTSGAVTAGAYLMGEFNINAINYDSSWTPQGLAAALRPLSIFLKGSVVAADPGTYTPIIP